ncbi:hypothetical protein C8F04DRAFT_1190394 [Mycena alexandri]|uniref:Uncharacterized protein n=1 Tax=Mycena alexandri TaxID=1745969 RepID=A0AAD6SFI2_9AGAR|nr:hypothetical protein C8F04DRAFT_1190394 [Mycena alexandri]
MAACDSCSETWKLLSYIQKLLPVAPALTYYGYYYGHYYFVRHVAIIFSSPALTVLPLDAHCQKISGIIPELVAAAPMIFRSNTPFSEATRTVEDAYLSRASYPIPRFSKWCLFPTCTFVF